MWVLWSLVGCLLCLAGRPAASSTNQCSWQDLDREEFSALPHTIQIQLKAKDQPGNMTIAHQNDDGSKSTDDAVSLEPSLLYNLSMTFKNKYYDYKLIDNKNHNISIKEPVFQTVFQKFIVEGHNLEWSQDCTETEVLPEGGGGSDQESNADNQNIWILALISSGVAVTVVAVGILIWSICSMCKKNSTR